MCPLAVRSPRLIGKRRQERASGDLDCFQQVDHRLGLLLARMFD